MDRTTLRTIATVNNGSRKTGDGLKGQFYDEQIGPVHVFRGPSDTGKTTRLMTPVVVALGLAGTTADPLLPYLGQRPALTSARLGFDTPAGPRDVVRDLSTGPTSGAGRKTALDVAEVMGAPPVRWDLGDFASVTDSKRAEIVEAIVRAGGDVGEWTVGRVVALLPVGPLTDTVAKTIDNTLSAADWIARAMEWAGTDGGIFTQRNTAHRTAAAHVEKLREAMPAVVDGDAAADNVEAERLRTALAAQQSVLDDLQRASSSYDAYIAEGARLRAAVASAERALADAQATEVAATVPLGPLQDAVDAAATQLEAAKTRTTQARDMVVEAKPVDCAAEEAALAQAREALAAAEDAVKLAQQGLETARVAYRDAQAPVDPALQQALDEAQAALSVIEARRDSAKARLSSAQARLDTLREQGLDAVCVKCGAADPLGLSAQVADAEATVRDAAEMVEDVEAVIDLRREAVQERSVALTMATQLREQRLATATETGEQARTVLEQAQAQAQTCRQAVSAADVALERARSAGQREADAVRARAIAEAQAAESAAAEALQSARDALALRRRQNDDAGAESLRRTQAMAAAKTALEHAQAALAAYQQQPAPAEPGSAAEVEGVMARLRAELAPVAERQRARQKVADAQAQLEAAEQAATKAEAALDEVKSLRAALEEVRDTIASEAFLPLEQAANRLLNRTGDAIPFRVYFDSPSDFGTVDEAGTRVVFWALGDGRKLVVAAGIFYAFAAVSKAPWRPVLIDGIESMPTAWTLALLAALVDAHADGDIDNALISWQTDDRRELPAGVTVSDLGTVGQLEAA